MLAVIHRTSSHESPALLSIAGKPLLYRQLQWLRAIGCDKVIVEIPRGRVGEALRRRIELDDVIIPGTVWVESDTPLSMRNIAKQAGAANQAFLAIPDDVLGDGDLSAILVKGGLASSIALWESPFNRGLNRLVSVRVVSTIQAKSCMMAGPGWAVRIRNEHDAWKLTLQLLDGTRKAGPNTCWAVQIHGVEERPGVWIARGAKVHPLSVIEGPALIGPGVTIGRGAKLGPKVVVEENAFIGQDTLLRHTHVSSGTIVPDGMLVEDAMLTPGWVLDLEAPSRPRHSVPELGSIYPTGKRRRPSAKRHALAAIAAVAVAAFATNWMFHHLTSVRSTEITTVEAPPEEAGEAWSESASVGPNSHEAIAVSVAPNVHDEAAEGHSK